MRLVALCSGCAVIDAVLSTYEGVAFVSICGVAFGAGLGAFVYEVWKMNRRLKSKKYERFWL